jgi:small subunit ribosomal protein S16
MLAIKLQRIGRKHQPSYRLVVAEKRSKMAGPPIEDLGSYNSFTKKSTINKDRVSYWFGVGARPTVTVHNFLVKEGIVKSAKLPVKMKKKEAAPAAAPAAAEAPAATA